MRFKRFPFHPAPIGRTRRRIKNAERSIQKERDDIPLFPEMVRFKTVDERLDHIDAVQMYYWQKIRNLDARMWLKFRKRLRSLPLGDQQAFVSYWNAHTMIPGEACYACDTLLHFFKRDDWLKEDIEASTAQIIPGGVVEKLGRHTVTLRKSGGAGSGVDK